MTNESEDQKKKKAVLSLGCKTVTVHLNDVYWWNPALYVLSHTMVHLVSGWKAWNIRRQLSEKYQKFPNPVQFWIKVTAPHTNGYISQSICKFIQRALTSAQSLKKIFWSDVSISINRLFLWKTDFYEVCKLANCSMTNTAIPIPGARVMQTHFTTFVCQWAACCVWSELQRQPLSIARRVLPTEVKWTERQGVNYISVVAWDRRITAEFQIWLK